MEMKTHYRACNLCEAMCGLEIKHTDNKIISIKGDKNDTFSRGYICPKATALQDIYEDPDRIRIPMERTASGWQEISWQQALDKTAEGIKDIQKKYGNDSVATYLGNPNVHNMGAMLMGRHLHNAIHTRSRYSATSVDQLPHHIVAYHLFGHQLKIPVPDIDHCTHILIIGGNPIASNGSIMTVPDIRGRLKNIKTQKGKIVVIDPRKTETANVASEHHFIKPGTDALLLLAMINIVFRDKNVVLGHLETLLDDIKEIESYVARYTPERVAPLVGIKENEIERLVTDFCQAEAAVCYGRMGVSTQSFGLLCQYLIMIFNIVTGRLDQRGGLMFTQPAVDILNHAGAGYFGENHSRVRGLPSFNGEFPVSTLAEEILTEGDEQIRALITVAGNPVLSTPNSNQMDEALKKLDFMVSIDFYINQTNRHANIILPPVSPLEREHYDVIFHSFAVRNTTRFSSALFEPTKGAKHDWQIFMELEKRLRSAPNFKKKMSHKLLSKLGPKTVLDMLLRTGNYGGGINVLKGLSLHKLKKHPHGIDLGPLQQDLPQGLYHKDKKIKLNLVFYFKDLERIEKQFFIETTKDFNFLLIGRRHIRSNNSWLHNSYRLVKGKSRCTAFINPMDAAKLHLSENQKIRVRSRVGEIEIEAEITENIMPGVISIPHGWGHKKGDIPQKVASAHAGVCVNDLTDDMEVDSLSGNAVLNGVPVSIVVIPL
jgi:anaerobic selenocysteine-containing dehydrogenase